MATPIIDMAGQRFTNIVVIERSYVKTNQKSAMWVCRCDCGNIFITSRSRLLNGVNKSCGCGKYGKHIKHGLYKTAEYRAWRGMIGRCYSKTNKRYELYGGRGISVCKRWLNDFMNFYNDIGERPSKDHSIDRIDVNGNYEPENCKWSTQKEQCRNRRVNVKYNYNGKNITLPEWSELLGIPLVTLRYRIKTKMPYESVFSLSRQNRRPNNYFNCHAMQS